MNLYRPGALNKAPDYSLSIITLTYTQFQIKDILKLPAFLFIIYDKYEMNIINTDFIKERITQLHLQKDVSEHRMSLDLGHAHSYIHRIVSGKVLPSMTDFLSICDYFEITPEYFFKESPEYGLLLSRLYASARKLSEKDLTFVLELAERLADNTKK